MNEETKEWVDALIQGFANVVNKNTQNSATKDDLENFATKDDLKNFATKDDLKNLEERLTKAFSKAISQQTRKVLEVLGSYEYITEKHEKIFKDLKDSMDKHWDES
ncbi:MAG: hypothetical protein IEMM0008_1649 [bacterium]|nr:MAG: hypothetical protein IEMM0008_1649 [bacterium]